LACALPPSPEREALIELAVQAQREADMAAEYRDELADALFGPRFNVCDGGHR
jgi:hypothetical protein